MRLPIQTVGADSAYGTTLIFQTLEGMGIQIYTPGTTGGTTYQVELKRESFLYDAQVDQFICPKGKQLCAVWSEQSIISAVYTGRSGQIVRLVLYTANV